MCSRPPNDTMAGPVLLVWPVSPFSGPQLTPSVDAMCSSWLALLFEM
jgi:hypothetical protein